MISCVICEKPATVLIRTKVPDGTWYACPRHGRRVLLDVVPRERLGLSTEPVERR